MSKSIKTGLWLFGLVFIILLTWAFLDILLPKIEDMTEKEDEAIEQKEQTTTATEAQKKEEQTTVTSQTKDDDQRYFVASPYDDILNDILKVNPRDKKVKQIATMCGEMKPEGAAKILETMEESIAIEVFLKMHPKQAASILDNMEPDQAAKFMESLLKERQTDTDEVFGN